MNTLVYVALGLAILAIVFAIIAWVSCGSDDCCDVRVDSIYLNMAPAYDTIATGSLAAYTDLNTPMYLIDYDTANTPTVGTQVLFTPDCDLKQIELRISVRNMTSGETNTLSNLVFRPFDLSEVLIAGTATPVTLTTSTVTNVATGVATYVFTDPLPAGTPFYVGINMDASPDSVLTATGIEFYAQIVGICAE